MMNFTHSVSGGQVASELAYDPEEFRYLLAELADYGPAQLDRMAEEVSDLDDEEAQIIADWMRRTADRLQPASDDPQIRIRHAENPAHTSCNLFIKEGVGWVNIGMIRVRNEEFPKVRAAFKDGAVTYSEQQT